MSTLISQLPEDIRKKAEENRAACQHRDTNQYSDYLWEAFNWVETTEGYDYWSKVCREHYPKRVEPNLRQQLASIIDRRLSRNETIDLLVKLWEEGK